MICFYNFNGKDITSNLEELLFGYTIEEVQNMSSDEFTLLQFEVEQFFGVTIIKSN